MTFGILKSASGLTPVRILKRTKLGFRISYSVDVEPPPGRRGTLVRDSAIVAELATASEARLRAGAAREAKRAHEREVERTYRLWSDAGRNRDRAVAAALAGEPWEGPQAVSFFGEALEALHRYATASGCPLGLDVIEWFRQQRDELDRQARVAR